MNCGENLGSQIEVFPKVGEDDVHPSAPPERRGVD